MPTSDLNLTILAHNFRRHERRARAASYAAYGMSGFNLGVAILTQDLWIQAFFAILSLVTFLLGGSFHRLEHKARAYADLATSTLSHLPSTKGPSA